MSLPTPKKEDFNWAGMYRIPADIMDDLCSRFIVNVPEEEKKDVVRLLFQVELAHWFYIDFYCSEESNSARKNPHKNCNFKEFSANIFKHLPFLHKHIQNFDRIIEQFREYKQAVPTYGAILLNDSLTHVLLVQGFWSKSSWGFPKGKVNEQEDPARCAVREVLEETGYDISHLISSQEFLETTVNDQLTRLYLIPGVPHDTKFIPRTRNEIRDIQWFPIADLPTSKKDAGTKLRLRIGPSSFFMVFPFVKLIRNWVLTHQQLQMAGSRRKQRRKSLEEKSITGILPRPKPGGSEDDSEPANVHQRLSKSAAHPGMSISGGSGTNKGRSQSRRQLFADKAGPTTTTPSTSPYSAPSWLNFKLNMAPIMACFD